MLLLRPSSTLARYGHQLVSCLPSSISSALDNNCAPASCSSPPLILTCSCACRHPAGGSTLSSLSCRPTAAFSTASSGLDSASQDEQRAAYASKLLYRSKQRGFLELDLLVGLWAEKNIHSMDAATLDAFSKVLDQENPDLFQWLTGRTEPSEAMLSNAPFMALRQHVAQQLGEHSVQAARAAAGRDWVRGWDDSWRTPPVAAAKA